MATPEKELLPAKSNSRKNRAKKRATQVGYTCALSSVFLVSSCKNTKTPELKIAEGVKDKAEIYADDVKDYDKASAKTKDLRADLEEAKKDSATAKDAMDKAKHTLDSTAAHMEVPKTK